MIYLYLFGTCFHFIYVFMIIGNIPIGNLKKRISNGYGIKIFGKTCLALPLGTLLAT